MELLGILLLAIILGVNFAISPEPREAVFGQGMLTISIPLFLFVTLSLYFWRHDGTK
jgi:hypothetical protein